MAVDPRKYTIIRCTQSEDNRKRDFFESIGKVGDLEVLNDIGLGKIGEGFRTLGSISDAIRVGTSIVAGKQGSDTYNTFLGKIMGTARDAVNEGANTVLDALGLGGAIDKVAAFSPEVANRSWGEAKALFEKIKDGNLDWRDVPELLQDFQNLETLAKGIFSPGAEKKIKGDQVTMCAPSPYATDLIAFAPKFKFLFIVQIEWNPIYAPFFKDLEATFVIKNSTRPNVNVEYEDINMYNFKTQIPKTVAYQPMTMRFYDDNWNQAMILWTAYLKAISPIANMDFTDQGISASGVLEENAMSWGNYGTAYGHATNTYSASYGVPPDGVTKDIFKQINLYHIYREGRLMNVYQFYNPRIENFVLDDVDMADGAEGNEVELSFKYDGLYVKTGVDLNPLTRDHKWDVEFLSGSGGRALWPIIFNNPDLASQCVNKDINVYADDDTSSEVTRSQEINTTADGLVGQVDQLSGLLDSAAGAAKSTGSWFKTIVNDSQLNGGRQEAQRAATVVNNNESGGSGRLIDNLF